MNKKEVAEMFKYIMEFYPEFEFTERTVAAWQNIIHFMKKEHVYECLQAHIKTSSYPPKIADIYSRWHGHMHPQSDHKKGE